MVDEQVGALWSLDLFAGRVVERREMVGERGRDLLLVF